MIFLGPTMNFKPISIALVLPFSSNFTPKKQLFRQKK